MTTLNLNTITIETFEIIISNLVGTDCSMEFSNYTEEHERIAMHKGLTISVDETMTVFEEVGCVSDYY
tara:strand:+ start:317 stop:520 length:204 start_codon:yes stop_codon:yes gene_type:complete